MSSDGRRLQYPLGDSRRNANAFRCIECSRTFHVLLLLLYVVLMRNSANCSWGGVDICLVSLLHALRLYAFYRRLRDWNNGSVVQGRRPQWLISVTSRTFSNSAVSVDQSLHDNLFPRQHNARERAALWLAVNKLDVLEAAKDSVIKELQVGRKKRKQVIEVSNWPRSSV